MVSTFQQKKIYVVLKSSFSFINVLLVHRRATQHQRNQSHHVEDKILFFQKYKFKLLNASGELV